jgi:hypothetical protein
VNVPLIAAGSLALLGAAIHGGVGEVLVVRRLSPNVLPSTRLGGGGFTKTMIRATWHITTVAFISVGSALVFAGILHGDTAHRIGILAAATNTGFAAVIWGSALAQGVDSARRGNWRPFRHPAPALFVVGVVLAWVGVAI